MTVRKAFWESAKFTAALGMIAKGAAMAYGEITGNLIDADQVAEIVEQGATIIFGVAASIATAISVYKSVTGMFRKLTGKEKAVPEETLPWLKK